MSTRHYKANRAYAFAAIKSRMQRWLLSVPATLDDIVKLFTVLMRNLIAIVPGLQNAGTWVGNRITQWLTRPAHSRPSP
jgi:hypothetical protein